MVNYQEIANIMQAQKADNVLHTKKEFETIMKGRKLTFKQNIDTVNGVKREVWGNRNFEVIVLNMGTKYQIL